MIKEPIISPAEVSGIIEVASPVTGYNLVRELLALKILREVPYAGRGKRVAYGEYLDLFR